jgi:hypothetical protein
VIPGPGTESDGCVCLDVGLDPDIDDEAPLVAHSNAVWNDDAVGVGPRGGGHSESQGEVEDGLDPETATNSCSAPSSDTVGSPYGLADDDPEAQSEALPLPLFEDVDVDVEPKAEAQLDPDGNTDSNPGGGANTVVGLKPGGTAESNPGGGANAVAAAKPDEDPDELPGALPLP